MNYGWMKYEDIEKAEYPNLLAELKESGYSICTISEWINRGRCKEDNQEIWDLLTGRQELFSCEAIAIGKLFGVELDYLFSNTLSVINDKPTAYWRWYDWNKKNRQEYERNIVIENIARELKEKPNLIDFIRMCINLNDKQIEKVMQMLQETLIE